MVLQEAARIFLVVDTQVRLRETKGVQKKELEKHEERVVVVNLKDVKS
jgi:hypothetical protein